MIHSLNHFKFALTQKLYIEPADRDYLIARWLLLNEFVPEFFWHASQAVETYLKAGLTINDISARKTGHDLKALFDDHRKTFGDLAVTELRKPSELSSKLWREQTVEHFLTQLQKHGSPDSRYGLISWHRNRDDMFKLDQICWNLRRLSVGLSWLIGKDFPFSKWPEYSGKSFEEALRTDDEFLPRSGVQKLDGHLFFSPKRRDQLLFSWNFSFQGDESDLSKMPPPSLSPFIGPATNSYLHIFWEYLTQKDEYGHYKQVPGDFLSGIRWMLEIIKLPSEVRDAFFEELESRDLQDQ